MGFVSEYNDKTIVSLMNCHVFLAFANKSAIFPVSVDLWMKEAEIQRGKTTKCHYKMWTTNEVREDSGEVYIKRNNCNR